MNRSCRHVVATASLLFGLVSVASARDYYVSPTGNNRNPGTLARPWKTIAKVNSTTFYPGDRVLFMAGSVYTGRVSLDSRDRGTAAYPIVIGSYGTGRATISAGKGGGISVYDTAGVRIENLNVVGVGRAYGNLADGIVFYTDIAVPGNKLDTIQVDNVDVSGFGKTGLVLGAWATDRTGAGIKTGFKNVRFTNVSAHDNADGGISSFGSYNALSTDYAHTNVYVGNCKAFNNLGISGKGGNSGNGIVLSDVDNGLIEHCVAYNNGQNNDHWGGPVGIWVWDSNAVTIQYSESYSNKSKTNDGGGFDLDGGCSNCVMQYNYSHDNVGNGLLVYQFGGARPETNNVVQYNASVNDAFTNGGGLTVGGGATNTLFNGNYVAVSPRWAGYTAGAPATWIVDDGQTNSNTIFRNNQFVAKGGVPLVCVPQLTLQKGIYYTGNTYTVGTDPFSIRWGTKTFTNLTAWRTATGQEP